METPVQPKLVDLMARFLSKQSQAHAAGLGHVDLTAEVVPFEAGPVQPVDPRSAWEEAVAVAGYFHPHAGSPSWTAPPDWPQLVASQEPIVALAFCLGNYPQLLRDWHSLLHQANPVNLRPQPGRPLDCSALLHWAGQAAGKNQFPAMLLAVGALRLAKRFDQAEDYLRSHERAVPSEWRPAWANEKAALAWHSGQGEQALKQWQQQEPTVPVLFNRGMASLFLGRSAEARTFLAQAVAQLPETRAWHHLGKLYLALAERKEG